MSAQSAAFHDFALDLATHYKAPQFGGHVKYWGMWNEPNLPSFLSPQYVKKNGKRTLVSADIYRTLLNRGARAVHQVDPDNRVIGGETAPFGHPNSPSPLAVPPQAPVRDNSGQKTCSKSRVEADIWATHPYTSGNPGTTPSARTTSPSVILASGRSSSRARPARAASLNANQNVRRSIRLWNTEFSWDTKPPDDKGVPMKLHARWTAEALYRTWSLGIETLFWLQLRDYPVGDVYQSGLYRYKNATTEMGAAKLSLTAFRFPFVAYASNGRIKVWGRTPGQRCAHDQDRAQDLERGLARGEERERKRIWHLQEELVVGRYEGQVPREAREREQRIRGVLARAAARQVRKPLRRALALSAGDGEEPRAEARVVERPLRERNGAESACVARPARPDGWKRRPLAPVRSSRLSSGFATRASRFRDFSSTCPSGKPKVMELTSA